MIFDVNFHFHSRIGQHTQNSDVNDPSSANHFGSPNQLARTANQLVVRVNEFGDPNWFGEQFTTNRKPVRGSRFGSPNVREPGNFFKMLNLDFLTEPNGIKIFGSVIFQSVL